MTRVGFCIEQSPANQWLGGFNYFLNLFEAIRASGQIEPVLFGTDAALARFAEALPWIERVNTPFAETTGGLAKLRKLGVRLSQRDLALDRVLSRHRIDVLSHSTPLAPRLSVPTINWIPDFQYRHLPELFSEENCAHFRVFNKMMIDRATTVLVSSYHAKNDLETFYPEARGRGAVLRFVSGMLPPDPAPRSHLEQTYDLTGPFFYFPGQIWISKNHRVVVEALARARDAGRPVTVVSTGAPWDFRAPTLFEDLKTLARDLGCDMDFRPLGVVPYADVASLMHHCVAMVNPSLFEGWSTTVEEAKSLGKTILLSRIPVHEEQAPEHGAFFDTADADGLAQLLIETLDGFDPEAEALRQETARALLPERFASFALRYENIVKATLDPARPDPDLSGNPCS